MSITEKVAYLKGLIEGMEIDADSKEGKLLKAICDVLADLALDQEDLQDTVAELSAQVDEIDEDLNEVEQDLYEDEDEDEDEDEEFYEVCCPACHAEFSVDEQTLIDGCVECPECGEHLDFDIDCDCDCDCCDCDDDDCDCDCDCGCDCDK